MKTSSVLPIALSLLITLGASAAPVAPVASPASRVLHAQPPVGQAPGTWAARVSSRFGDLVVRPMFGSGERKALSALGRARLADTVSIGPVADEQLESFLAQWKQAFGDLAIEMNGEAKVQQLGPTPNPPARPAQPGDPLLGEQWALDNSGQDVRVDIDDIRTNRYDSRAGEDLRLPPSLPPGREVRVAVLDTGVDLAHPDLAPQLVRKESECKLWDAYQLCAAKLEGDSDKGKAEAKACVAALGNLDSDGNGYPMDCQGWNVVDNVAIATGADVIGSPNSLDDLGHGTHVAGVIGASIGNRVGVRGIAPNVRIIPVKVISASPNAPVRPQGLGPVIRPAAKQPNEDGDGDGEIPSPREAGLKWATSSVDLIARGMLYAIRERAEVINLSLGWPATLDSQIMREMVKLAQDRGIMVIAAAGNDSTDMLVQPCSYPEVLCVGAHGPDGKRAYFSNAGPGVDLFAPGVSILSTWPMSQRPTYYTDRLGYDFLSGTSMAAPQVSGVFALMLGQGLKRDDVLSRLLASGRPIVDGYDAVKVDTLAALSPLARRPVIRPVQKAPLRIDWDEGETGATLSLDLRNIGVAASGAQARARLDLRSPLGTRDVTVDVGTADGVATFGAWAAGEVKPLPLRVTFTGPQVPKLFWVEVTVVADGIEQKRLIPIEVHPTPAHVRARFISSATRIEGVVAGRNPQPRSVSMADGSTDTAFMLASTLPAGEGRAYQLLLPTGKGGYRLSAAQKPSKSEGDLLLVQRYRSQEDGKPRWAFIFRSKNLAGVTVFRFEIFNEAFTELLRVISYDGVYAPLPERFRWTMLDGKDAIAFFARGKAPVVSRDPWLLPDESQRLRFYVLDAAGVVRELEAPKPYRAVLLAPETAADRARKEVRLILILGDGYDVEYSLASFSDGKIQSIQPFSLSEWRNIAGLPLSNVLTDSGIAPAWAVAGPVHGGRIRITRMFRDGESSFRSDDITVAPPDDLDAVTRLAGAFELGGQASFFTQTTWSLQFHQAGKTVSTSLNRFSFLPLDLFQRGFFASVLSDGEAHLPAELVLDLDTDGISLSVIYPELAADGTPLRLLRPALLRFESGKGCSFVGNPQWDDVAKKTMVFTLCGDELRALKLEVPHDSSR